MPKYPATFKFDVYASVTAIKLILSELGGVVDFITIFKVLYFADKKHLSKWGKPICGDTYVAMKDGPVPSRIYDEFKSLRGAPKNSVTPSFNAFKAIGTYRLQLIDRSLDFDDISESAVDSLMESIKENKALSSYELSVKSHDSAWDKADTNNSISYVDMAESAGASEDVVHLVRENLGNASILT